MSSLVNGSSQIPGRSRPEYGRLAVAQRMSFVEFWRGTVYIIPVLAPGASARFGQRTAGAPDAVVSTGTW